MRALDYVLIDCPALVAWMAGCMLGCAALLIYVTFHSHFVLDDTCMQYGRARGERERCLAWTDGAKHWSQYEQVD